MLRARHQSPTLEWLSQLPAMSCKIESILYHKASSRQMYIEAGTLELRIERELVTSADGSLQLPSPGGANAAKRYAKSKPRARAPAASNKRPSPPQASQARADDAPAPSPPSAAPPLQQPVLEIQRPHRITECRARCAHEASVRAPATLQEVLSGPALGCAKSTATKPYILLCPNTDALNYATTACTTTAEACFQPGRCKACDKPRIAWPVCTKCNEAHHPRLLDGRTQSCTLSHLVEKCEVVKSKALKSGACCKEELAHLRGQQQTFLERWRASLWALSIPTVQCECAGCGAAVTGEAATEAGGAAASWSAGHATAANGAVNGSEPPQKKQRTAGGEDAASGTNY